MSSGVFELISKSAETTERLGEVLAGLVPLGSVVALRGDLASGKTCLVRGMARRYSRGEIVSSPTFTIVNQYGTGPALLHVDLYRIDDLDELGDLGYEDLFDPEGVCVVEWAERAETLLPPCRLDIRLEYVDMEARRIRFEDRGVLPAGWQDTLQREFPA